MKRFIILFVAGCAGVDGDGEPDAGSHVAELSVEIDDDPLGSDWDLDSGGWPMDKWVGDADHDGLQDAYEDALLYKFAPRIWLHQSETRFPVNVDYLLKYSRLRFSHGNCPDHGLLGWGQVSRENMTEQLHRSSNGIAAWPPWDACSDEGPYHSSSSYPPDDRMDTFFLQFTDATHTGLSTPSAWQLYGHVYGTSTGHIEIQYWQLYAYNDSFASSNHEGDWEYTGVTLDVQEAVQQVVYFRHGRRTTRQPQDVQWVGGTHHVTYSAKGGHAQYAAATATDLVSSCVGDSVGDDTQGFADECSHGYSWDSWAPGFGGIVNVGESWLPRNNSNWLRYSGLWGEIGAAGDLIAFTSGPPGPAWQSTWLAQ